MARTTRYVAPQEQAAFLAEARAWRLALVRMLARAPIGSPFYRALNGVNDAIDDLAEAVTGDRRALHDKPHSISGG